MSVDDRFQAQFIELSALRATQRGEAGTLKHGGGGGTSGGVEDRVARLEKQFDQMTKDVGDLRVDMATLKERVAHLPGKGFIVTATSTTIVLMIAAVTFADKLRALVG